MEEDGVVEMEEWIDFAMIDDQLQSSKKDEADSDEEASKRPPKIELPKFTREQFLQLHKKAMHVKSHAVLKTPPRSPRKPPLPKLGNTPSPRRQISHSPTPMYPTSPNANASRIKDETLGMMTTHTQGEGFLSISPSPRIRLENEKVQSILLTIDRLMSQRKKDQHQDFTSSRNEGKDVRLQNWEKHLQRVEELLDQLRHSYSETSDSSDEDILFSRTNQGENQYSSRAKPTQTIKQSRTNTTTPNGILPSLPVASAAPDASYASRSARHTAREDSPTQRTRSRNTNRSKSPSSPTHLTRANYVKTHTSRQKTVPLKKKEMDKTWKDDLEKKLEEKESKQLVLYRTIFEKIQQEKQKLASDWRRLHCQRIWLIAIGLVRRHMTFVQFYKQARENHEKVGKMIICAIKIQRIYRRHVAKKQANRELMAIHTVYRLVRRYVKRWKYNRKKEHAQLIVIFLKSCRGVSQAVLGVKKFLRRVKQIQSAWRTYRAQFNSQFELLSLQWDKIEQIIFSFLRDNHGIGFLRIPKSKLKLKSLIEVQQSKIVGGSSRTIPNQSLLPIYRFTLNRPELLTKPTTGTRSVPRYSPSRGAGGPHQTSHSKYRYDEYMSPISRDIKLQLLRPYILAMRRQYRDAIAAWNKELGHMTHTREKMQNLLRRSSNSTMGFFAERYRASCDIIVGRPFLRLLMKPEDMQHMVEQGYIILEQERKLDEYVYHK
eukprot:TRINITY_DN3546_c0_g1_i1.p1 TRINITY_DN3546_c0_g1~~TRINITY_DN3546_c0_g1_i1.p1  ORF type:complete len:715 (-),score=123.61 TRINITY_DN3546_c0_g1_i1:305-2449(-)